jgi:hypothetical protein
MDDNTTKVLLAAIFVALIVAVIRQSGGVSLRLERLDLSLLGWLKLSIRTLKVTLQQHSERGTDEPLMIASGNVDLIVLTHLDSDHRNGLLSLFESKCYRKD